MPRAGYLWRHVIINTHCSWLHGNPRGFRSRNSEIRSSGDYKNPPPPGEYRKLHEHFQKVADAEVTLPKVCRSVVGRAMVNYLEQSGHRVLCVSVAKVHAHVLVELPRARVDVKRIIGEVKRKSSRAVKKELPGKVWSAGGEFKIVKNRGHLFRAFEYVLYDQGEGAWSWSVRDGSNLGVFGRKRRRGPALRSGPP